MLPCDRWRQGESQKEQSNQHSLILELYRASSYKQLGKK